MNQKSINNPLFNEISILINKQQFISVYDFIKLCLYHPQLGYYKQALPIGLSQDFTTAPEISQLFGEMLGFWFIKQWNILKEPSSISLIELGAGNGTLMFDLLNLIKKVPKINKVLTISIVEINSKLIEKQQKKLIPLARKANIPINWLSDIAEFKNNSPTIIIANEFLDTFPVKQFKFTNGAWHEVLVTIDKKNSNYFSLALAKKTTELSLYLPKQFIPQENMIFEYSPCALNYFKKVTSLLKNNKGAAAIIDYGYLYNSYKNTIQAISKHKYTNFLLNPSKNDITHLVNFPLLIEEISGLGFNFNINTQQHFFLNLGIKQRVEVLLKIATNQQKNAILTGVNRIINPKEMGCLFKVLEIFSN